MSEYELWNELGNLYFLSGAYGQAVRAYRRSIEMDEGFGRPYSNLALTYVQQGKYDEAVELYRRSIELLAESKDRAITWNRLGNVYRQLKDYKKAVVAYQEADELDPESTEGRDEPGWLDGAGPQVPLNTEDHSTRTDEGAPMAAVDQVPDPGADQSALAPDDFTASWALTELAPYQQDVSTSPEANPLTAWGEPNFDDEDIDPYMPTDPESEVYIPDTDGTDLTKWLPIPEEELAAAMQASTDEGGDSMSEEDLQAEASETAAADMGNDISAESPVTITTEAEAPSAPEIMLPVHIRRDKPRHEYAEQAVERAAVEVDVEERPTPEFVLAVDQMERPALEAEHERDSGGEVSESISIPQSTMQEAAEESASEDGAEDLQEYEAEIAKYKRVVQINSHNAHAWDALGNLYKSSGRYPEARLAYQQAVSNEPGRALYHHHLALIYACEGHMEEAIGALQRVLEIDPDHNLAHATLGGYYRKMGLEELAQTHIGRAMKSIFDSENEYNRACLAAICGNTDEALELLRVALQNKQTYVDWILRDPDLDFIRQDPRFKQLISDYAR